MKQEPAAELKRHYKTLRSLYFVYLVAAVLALGLFFFNRYLTLAVLAASFIYHFAFLRPKSKAYERAFVHTCAQLTLDRYLGHAEHTPSPILTSEELRAARLIAHNDSRGSILCREGGSGNWAEGKVRMGDVTFTHSFPMDGKTHHEFVTGLWTAVELGHDTGLSWRFLDRRAMMRPSRDQMCRAHPELKILRDGTPQWADDGAVVLLEDEYKDQPSAAFLQELKSLKESTKGALAVCVDGGTLHVFITNRMFGQKVSIRLEPQDALASADIFPELGHILRAAEKL